jgi:hypothetical protein
MANKRVNKVLHWFLVVLIIGVVSIGVLKPTLHADVGRPDVGAGYGNTANTPSTPPLSKEDMDETAAGRSGCVTVCHEAFGV